MGKIFLWSEIQNRQVPTANNFRRVIELLKRELSHAQAITTAVLCGSVVRGDHTLRSDIDCLVLYNADQMRIAFAIMHWLTEMASRQNVPLTFIPCSTDIAATRMHHFGPSFFEHVERSAHTGGTIKGWPPALYQERGVIWAELESYFRVKLYSLEEQWAEYPSKSHEQRVRTLKKMFEAPMHVARKTLARVSDLKGDSKNQIHQQYREQMPIEIAARLGYLIDLDREYTEHVGRQLEEPNEIAYSDMLGYLEENIPKVISFVKENVLYIAKTVPAP